MREKGGKQVENRKKLKAERRFCSWARGKSSTPQKPVPLYPYFPLNARTCFTPKNPRTISRLLSESLESLRELHHDYGDKNCFCVNHCVPSSSPQEVLHIGSVVVNEDYYSCSGQHPSTCSRSCKARSCLGCQTQVTNDSYGGCCLAFSVAPILSPNVSFCLFQNKQHYNHFLFTSLTSPWLLLLSLVVATPLNLLPSANIISYCLFPLPHC